MERLRQKIKFGKWHRLIQDGPSFFGGRHFTQSLDRSFKVDMTRFNRERIRPIHRQRERCLDKSAEATEGEVKRCEPWRGLRDNVGLTRQEPSQHLQGSVSRAVVKDLSDANRAVNRLKQTEDVGLLIHGIRLGNLRTVSTSAQTVRLREASWSVLPRQSSTSKGLQSCHLCPGRKTK